MKIHGLTPRQWEIAQLAGQCIPPKEIAKRLLIDVSTLYRHLEKIRAAWRLDPKLDLQGQIVRRMAAPDIAA